LKAFLFVPAFYFASVYPVSYLNNPEVMEKDMVWLIGYCCLAFFIFRCRYFFGWFLAEAAFVATGEAYNGVDKNTKKVRWDRVTNVRVLEVELPHNIRGITSNWNICTANWLKYYVYWRLPKNIRTYGTYFVSAFWHGFYPGYYLFFLYAALLTETGRVFRRYLRPLFLHPETVDDKGKAVEGKPRWFKIFYDVVGILLTLIFTNFGGVGFVVLSYEATVQAFGHLRFFGFMIVPPVFLYFQFVHPMFLRGKKHKEGSEKKKTE
jgi:lysophospholipid acyltransferase